MARIAGVNLPAQKHVWVGIQSIYGIGRTTAQKLLAETGVDRISVGTLTKDVRAIDLSLRHSED